MMSDADISKYYVPFATRLATRNWYTVRATACELLSFIYPRLSTEKRTFRSIFLRLCVDDSPLVRRQAIRNMDEMCNLVTQSELMSEFMGVFTSAAKDEHDSVKIQIIRYIFPF